MIFNFFRDTAGAIRAINQKYAKPHIKMTRMVRISLGVLRFYLLLLVGILVYKFITLLH
jgi:hypothetical protein